MTAVTALIALAIATGAAGCGDSEVKQDSNSVDGAFVQLSITLNENAIALSDKAAKDGKSTETRATAADIAADRRAENEQLAKFAEDLGVDAGGGPPSAADLTALALSGDQVAVSDQIDGEAKSAEFDAAYAKLMEQNVNSSFRVARPEVINGGSTEVVDFAKQQISDRTLELERIGKL